MAFRCSNPLLVMGVEMTASAKSDTPRTDADCEAVRQLFKRLTGVDVEVKTVNGEFVVTDHACDEYKTGLVRKQ